MAQFDVYANPNPETNEAIPYLLDIQHDLLSGLSTRLVIPMVSEITPIQHLTPSLEVAEKRCYLMTPEMAGVPLHVLGEKITSLKPSRQQIISAVDFLMTGF